MELECFRVEMREGEGKQCKTWKQFFLTPKISVGPCLYGTKEGVKVGEKGGKLSPTKYPPDTDIFWGIKLYSCKVNSVRIMAGLVFLLQVAGRPHALAGWRGVKRGKLV